MAKAAYFVLPVVVGLIAIAGYFIMQEARIQEPNTDEHKSHSKRDADKSADQDTTLMHAQSDELNDKQPPSGHLKKLGEHGSPVVTTHIEELDYTLNGKDFYSYFIRKRTPVIMRGAARNWPAFHHWQNKSYLIEKYGEQPFRVESTKKYENAPPIHNVMTMKEFLDIFERSEVYLDSPFPQSNMTKDIMLPSCLQCKELNSNITSIHLLYSSGGTSSNFHYDGSENLLSVLSGTKEVLLSHYNNTKYFSKKGEMYANVVSPINPEAVDLIKFPHLVNVTFHKVNLGLS